MSMNLPNKLTMFRVVLIPVFIVVLMSGLIAEPASRYIAVVIFCVASFTDYLDGHIARKYNLVTNFGKFMDPLADKLLVSAAMICMIELGNNRIQTYCGRRRSCNCRKLVGKNKNGYTDGNDYSYVTWCKQGNRNNTGCSCNNIYGCFRS